MSLKVAVLGASANPDRYSNKAIKMLSEYGHQVFPVNPTLQEIDGLKVFSDLSAIPEAIHTITVYVGPQNIGPLISKIIAAKPKRVIMNPGAESDALKEAATKAQIECIEACTLVMLRTKQFS